MDSFLNGVFQLQKSIFKNKFFQFFVYFIEFEAFVNNLEFKRPFYSSHVFIKIFNDFFGCLKFVDELGGGFGKEIL